MALQAFRAPLAIINYLYSWHPRQWLQISRMEVAQALSDGRQARLMGFICNPQKAKIRAQALQAAIETASASLQKAS